MKRPRILLAGLYHESHTFIDQPTRWEDFKISLGQDVLAKQGDESPTDGFLTVAQQNNWDVIPTIDAHAMPSGTVESEVFERLWKAFESHARPALAVGIDAIFLVLHGAMVTQALEDPEGEFLERIRKLPGAAHLPLFGVIDLHANVTARMCALANGLVTYRKNPHTDAKATAIRAATLLQRCLTEGKVPHMAWCRVPIMWAPPGTGTAVDPMRALTALAEKSETGAIWAYNVAAGFSFADTAQTGVTLSAITDAAPAQTPALLQAGAELAWSLRARGDCLYPSVDTVLATLKPSTNGPTLLVEPADNIGGGAPGDGTGILRAFIAHQTDRALVAINDPQTVEHLAVVPVGETARVSIGGRSWRLDPGPVELDVTLISRRDGLFTLEDPHSHLAATSGIRFDMGPCAVVKHRGVTILLTSRKTPPFDLGQFTSQGLDPRSFAFIGVKAAIAHKRAYDPIIAATYYVDTTGPCTSALASLPYQRLKRPVYPLDPLFEPHFIFA